MTAVSDPTFTPSQPLVWVIDDDSALRTILEDTLTDSGYDVKTFGNAQTAWQTLEHLKNTPMITANLRAVIITDIRMPMMNGLVLSEKIQQHFSSIPIIVMTAHADVQSAVDSYQAGAFDYLPKPFDLEDAIHVVNKAYQQHSQQHAPPIVTALGADTPASAVHHQPAATQPASALANVDPDIPHPSGIIGQSLAMQKVFRAIGRLSHMPMTVLITGESGTGKELIASALHQHSPRKNKPFIALNMAAIPHDLIEAELFGHEKGAFTGASNTRQGRFEQAHGGTLFLDEIGDMPLPTQTRLLRVLANGEFYRVGGLKPIKVDVRIIAATHQNLEDLVRQGRFREDLFYRLNVIRLSLPALRERQEDIPLLIQFFMQHIAKITQTVPKTITPHAMTMLQHYPWQGNVRQLENTCRWLTVMTTGHTIVPTDLPPEILHAFDNAATLATKPATLAEKPPTSIVTPHTHLTSAPNEAPPTQDWVTPLQHWAKIALAKGQQDILQTAYPIFEKCLLEVALHHTDQHKGQAADLLGWGRNTVTRKYQQLIEGKTVK